MKQQFDKTDRRKPEADAIDISETENLESDDAPQSTKQTSVPEGDPGDPTEDTWQRIHRNKVQTTKEEMPSPKRP